MDREKTWRFDLNKMGAKSYGSVRPFGGEPQPLKEIPIQDPEIFIDYSIFQFGYAWIVQRKYQGKDFCSVNQVQLSTEKQAIEKIEKWKKEDNRKEVCDPMRSYENMPDYV